jgi:osmotically-inducible protein OsmY
MGAVPVSIRTGNAPPLRLVDGETGPATAAQQGAMSLKHIGNVDDYDVAEALTAFARNATGEDVHVEFAAGAATISGRVASAQARRAIEDLIAAHEGVESVVNALLIVSESPARRTPAG